MPVLAKYFTTSVSTTDEFLNEILGALSSFCPNGSQELAAHKISAVKRNQTKKVGLKFAVAKRLNRSSTAASGLAFLRGLAEVDVRRVALEQPTREIWKGGSPFSVNYLNRTDSISGACEVTKHDMPGRKSLGCSGTGHIPFRYGRVQPRAKCAQ